MSFLLAPSWQELPDSKKITLATDTSNQLLCRIDTIQVLYEAFKNSIITKNRKNIIVSKLMCSVDENYYSHVTFQSIMKPNLHLYVEFLYKNGFGYGICASPNGTSIANFGADFANSANRIVDRLVNEFNNIRMYKKNNHIFIPKGLVVIEPINNKLDITTPMRFSCYRQMLTVFQFSLLNEIKCNTNKDIMIGLFGDIFSNTLTIKCILQEKYLIEFKVKINLASAEVIVENIQTIQLQSYQNIKMVAAVIYTQVYLTVFLKYLAIFPSPYMPLISNAPVKNTNYTKIHSNVKNYNTVNKTANDIIPMTLQNTNPQKDEPIFHAATNAKVFVPADNLDKSSDISIIFPKNSELRADAAEFVPTKKTPAQENKRAVITPPTAKVFPMHPTLKYYPPQMSGYHSQGLAYMQNTLNHSYAGYSVNQY